MIDIRVETVKNEDKEENVLRVLGLVVRDDETFGLKIMNKPNIERPVTISFEQLQLLARLALFALQPPREGVREADLASWAEGYRAGLKSCLPIPLRN